MASEYGDFCRAQRQARSERNAKRYARNFREIDQLRGVDVRVVSDGHVRFVQGNRRIDFWLHTGTAQLLGTKDVRRNLGVRSVVRWLGEARTDGR